MPVETKEVGLKYDNEKPRVAEMCMDFADSLEYVAKIWAFGADKYGKSNWKHLDKATLRYTNAMLRHMFQEPQCYLDDESHMLHAAHVAWNALARLHFIIEEYKSRPIKDREQDKVKQLELFDKTKYTFGDKHE